MIKSLQFHKRIQTRNLQMFLGNNGKSSYLYEHPCRYMRSSLSTISSPSTISASDSDYCMNLVKKYDYDNFLNGLIWPKELRTSYFVLRAFNIEIALIKDQVRGNSLSGKMRYEWWREALDRLGQDTDRKDTIPGAIDNNSSEKSKGSSMDHPVLRGLQYLYRVNVKQVHRDEGNPNILSDSASVLDLTLNKRWLYRSLESRQTDMHINQYETLDDLETYAEQAHSSILYALYEVLLQYHEIPPSGGHIGGDNHSAQSKIDYCLSHIGTAYGLTLALRGLLHHLVHENNIIPVDTMEKHHLTFHNLTMLMEDFSNGLLSEHALEEDKSQQLSNEDIEAQALVMDSLVACIHDIASQAYAHQQRGLHLQKEYLAQSVEQLCEGTDIAVLSKEKQRQYHQVLKSNLYLLLLPAIRTSEYLTLLQTHKFNVLHDAVIQGEMKTTENNVNRKGASPIWYQLKLLKSMWYKCV